MLSIGQFSRACQVTIKTLRYYDKLGLVKPAYIDEQTGYRYYETDQVSQLLLIQRLKRYGFSLTEILQLQSIQDTDILRKKLIAQKQLLQQRLTETSSIVRELEQHLATLERTGNIMSYQNNYQITLQHREALPILSIRQRMGIDEFGYYYGKLFDQIVSRQLTMNGPLMAIYHDEEFHSDDNDTEVAAPIVQTDAATRILPGGLHATTIHIGAYASLPDAYGAVTRWISDNGYAIAGAPFEIYRKNHQDRLPVEQWETEIYFPINKQ